MLARAETETRRITLYPDEDAENPREWAHWSCMYCWDHRNKLGDDNPFRNPEEFYDWLKEQRVKPVVLPLYLYDHSGITMRTSSFADPWDSGQVGYIVMTREDATSCGLKRTWRKQATAILESEVSVYDRWLRGDFFGFEAEELVGDEWEQVDSCWGMFADTHKELVDDLVMYLGEDWREVADDLDYWEGL